MVGIKMLESITGISNQISSNGAKSTEYNRPPAAPPDERTPPGDEKAFVSGLGLVDFQLQGCIFVRFFLR